MVDRIREILHARQLSPTQFADAIGVARPIVSHILSGRNKPSLEVVQKISEAFPDLSLSWLMKGIGAMQAPKVSDTPSPVAPASSSTRRATAVRASETPPVAHDMPEAMRDKATTDIAPSGGAFEGQQSTVVGASQAPGAPAPNWPLFPTAPAAGPSLTPTGNTAGATPPHVPTPPLAYPYTAASASSSALEATSLGGKAPTGSTIQTETVVPSQAQAFVEKNKAIRRIVIFYQDGTFTDYQPDAK